MLVDASCSELSAGAMPFFLSFIQSVKRVDEEVGRRKQIIRLLPLLVGSLPENILLRQHCTLAPFSFPTNPNTHSISDFGQRFEAFGHETVARQGLAPRTLRGRLLG